MQACNACQLIVCFATDLNNGKVYDGTLFQYQSDDPGVILQLGTGKVNAYGWLRYSGFARHKDLKLDAAGALAVLLVLCHLLICLYSVTT